MYLVWGGGSLDTKSDFRKISNNNIKLKVLLNCEEWRAGGRKRKLFTIGLLYLLSPHSNWNYTGCIAILFHYTRCDIELFFDRTFKQHFLEITFHYFRNRHFLKSFVTLLQYPKITIGPEWQNWQHKRQQLLL